MKAITACQIKFQVSVRQSVHLITLYMAGVTGNKLYMEKKPEDWPQANYLLLSRMAAEVLKTFGESAFSMPLPDEAVFRRQEMILNIKGVLPIETADLRY